MCFFSVTAALVFMAKRVGGGGYYVRGEVSNLKRLLFFSFLARCMLHAQFWASESH